MKTLLFVKNLKTILANFGDCSNQQPHRDYSSLRIENVVQLQEDMDEGDNDDQEDSDE